jgi:hypothetical protein
VKDITRRNFLKLVGAGALGAAIAPRISSGAAESGPLGRLAKNLLDGRFASDVVQCFDENATSGTSINEAVVQSMMDASVKALSGLTDVGEAWKSFFPEITESSIVSIKVNCINSYLSTHPAFANCIVNGLARMTFGGNRYRKNNVIIWDRTDYELQGAGYPIYDGSDPDTARCFGSDHSGIGYDSGVTFSVNGVTQHPSKILSQMSSHVIDAAVLKTHSQGVVTLSMKNHYGSVNSPGSLQHSSGCSPAIPSLSQQIRDLITPNNIQKLFVIDALWGLYSGGPGGQPNFNPRMLIMSRDTVACDKQGQNVINAERARRGRTALDAAQITTAAQPPYSLGTTDVNLIELNTTTAVRESEPGPRAEGILRVSPLPFRDRTTLTFELPGPASVHLELVDAAGKTLADVFRGRLPPGRHSIEYHARRHLPGGTYFFRLRSGGTERLHKVEVLN